MVTLRVWVLLTVITDFNEVRLKETTLQECTNLILKNEIAGHKLAWDEIHAMLVLEEHNRASLSKTGLLGNKICKS